MEELQTARLKICQWCYDARMCFLKTYFCVLCFFACSRQSNTSFIQKMQWNQNMVLQKFMQKQNHNRRTEASELVKLAHFLLHSCNSDRLFSIFSFCTFFIYISLLLFLGIWFHSIVFHYCSSLCTRSTLNCVVMHQNTKAKNLKTYFAINTNLILTQYMAWKLQCMNK